MTLKKLGFVPEYCYIAQCVLLGVCHLRVLLSSAYGWPLVGYSSAHLHGTVWNSTNPVLTRNVHGCDFS